MIDLSMLTMEFECGCAGAINTLTEAANDYDISCQEVYLAGMQDSVLNESTSILYEDAASDFLSKGKAAIVAFFKSIGQFIAGIAKKISEFFKEKKTKETIQDVKESISESSEVAKEKVEVFDLAKMTKIQLKHFSEVQKLLIKKSDGEELDDDEMSQLDKWYKEEYDDVDSAPVEVPVKTAIEESEKAMAIAVKTADELTDLASKLRKKAEDDLNEAVKRGNPRAIKRCTKQLAKFQKAMTNLSYERVKIISKIDSNIAKAKAKVNKYAEKIAIANTESKYGLTLGQRMKGSFKQNSFGRWNAYKKKSGERELKGYEDDRKDAEFAYDTKMNRAYTKFANKVNK